jgi:hypothetical protein
MSTNPGPIVPAPYVEDDKSKPFKAYAGAFVTLLGLLWAALEGRDTLDNMSLMEWLSIVVPVILTFATIYGVRNPKVVDFPPKGEGPQIPVRDRDDVGAGEMRLLAIIAIAIVLGLFAWWVLTALLR